MTDDPDLHAALRGVLDAVEDAPPVDAVEAATRALGSALGALSVSFLIADLSGRALVRLTHSETPGDDVGGPPTTPADDAPGDAPDAAPDAAPDVDGTRRDAAEHATRRAFDGGPVERALQTQAVQVLPPAVDAGSPPGSGEARHVGWTVLAPVTERGEALGLLEMVLRTEPDSAVTAEIARTAHLLGFVVVASRRHTDLFEWAQRSTPYSLSAEIQRRLLPAGYTCATGSFDLSAWLEPSASVGGDTYDYSLARDALHLSITDAMGHGVASALVATLCVGSLRNSRRHGMSLVQQADEANDALSAHVTTVSSEAYSTGLLGRLDLRDGTLELVNAGHAAPYLMRGGTVRCVDVPPQLPFGLFPGTQYVSVSEQLQPGDRLVFVTDGMLERNAEDLDMAQAIAATRHLHPREAARALTDLVLEATGQALADDATLLMLDWHGDHGRDRRTRAGGAVGAVGAVRS